MRHKVKDHDQVVLVNNKDERIGVMDKIEAHKGNARLHRAISVFLVNTRGELLIQKRSIHKIVGAHLWANTACGNVWPNESRQACVRRRLRVELGITIPKTLHELFLFEYHVRCNAEYSEWEMDHVFFGMYEGFIDVNPQEVEHIKWVAEDELLEDIRQHTEEYAPWFLMMMKDQRIQTALGWKGKV